jgi:hypothetical protein
MSAAKALDELMLELIRKDVDIPAHVAGDLKSARSLAKIDLLEPGNNDIATKIMIAIENVEMNLLALADIYLGREASEEWQRKITKSFDAQPARTSSAPVSRIASGVPRSDHWIRIKSDYLDSVEGAMEMLEETSLSAIAQDDGNILIHGKKEDVSAFLKSIREKVKAGIS